MHMRRKVIALLTVGVLSTVTLFSAAPSMGIDLFGGALKGTGVVLLLNQFGGQINSFINTVTLNKGVNIKEKTKVVPILSVGQGGYMGAAQISGPAAAVDKVKAVAQIEMNMSGETFRIKALVPVASKDVVKDIKRIGGVGVSAIIDVRL